MSAESALKALEATKGWRLLLYTFLGTWIIGKTGTAVAEVIHGPTDYSSALRALAPDVLPAAPKPAPTKVSGVPHPAPIRVSGASDLAARRTEVDKIARFLAEKYGPLPAEMIPQEITVGGDSKAAPWIAGVFVAAIAAGYLLTRAAKGAGPVDIKVTPAEPVKVAPVDIKVKPEIPPLSDVLKQAMPGAAPMPTPGASQVTPASIVDLFQQTMQQAQRKA